MPHNTKNIHQKFFKNKRNTMKLHVIFSRLIFFVIIVLSPATHALAAGCLTSGCHQNLTKMKHMHGPIGAELAGIQGCIMCHIPAGSPCRPPTAGKFTIKGKDMCLTCHVKGSGSKHSNATTECLKCHNPHGSTTSPYMLRP